MAARLLDGTAVGQAIRQELAAGVAAFTARAGRPPRLALVLVGDDPASHLYVNSKMKSAGESGLRADIERLPATASLAALLTLIDRLNRSDVHDGILVQCPLPDAMGADAEQRVFDALDPAKDVDGFHPVNVGQLVQNRAPVAACTPSGIIELLDRSRHPDRRRPRRGDRPQRHRRQADGAAAAAPARHGDDLPFAHRRSAALWRGTPTSSWRRSGRPAFVTADFVKPGATVIDVGTTRVEDRAIVERLFAPGSRRHQAFERRGSLVVGDVHPEVEQVAGALTPVPGGVGPLTIAMLLKNTLAAAEARFGRS